jgi:hypothetical protein
VVREANTTPAIQILNMSSVVAICMSGLLLGQCFVWRMTCLNVFVMF